MNIAEMRRLLSLGDDVSDAAVAQAYAAFLTGSPDEEHQPPISLAEAKRQLKVELDDDSRDDEIASLIERAVGWVERETTCVLSARTLTLPYDDFDAIILREWPVQLSASATVQYHDGVQTVTVPARIIGARRPHRLAPVSGAAWPAIPPGEIVTVTVRVGYEASQAVPPDLRSAVLIMLSAYDVDREGGALFQKAEVTASRLCFPFTRFS